MGVCHPGSHRQQGANRDAHSAAHQRHQGKGEEDSPHLCYISLLNSDNCLKTSKLGEFGLWPEFELSLEIAEQRLSLFTKQVQRPHSAHNNFKGMVATVVLFCHIWEFQFQSAKKLLTENVSFFVEKSIWSLVHLSILSFSKNALFSL